MGDRRYDKLNIEDWVVDQAYPPSDIIWADIEQVQENGTCKSFLPFINLSASFGVIFVAMFFDQWAFRDQKAIMLVIQYFCPFLVALFTLWGSPLIIFELTQLEYNERKSVKEASFLGKLNFMLTFNLIFCPYIANLVLDALIIREIPSSYITKLFENFL